MYIKSRDEKVKLLKRLWTSQATLCPKCGNDELVHFHKKAKKSDCGFSVPKTSYLHTRSREMSILLLSLLRYET